MNVKNKKRLITAAAVLLILAGSFLLVYPIYINYQYTKLEAQDKARYQQENANKTEEEWQAEIQKAEAYNATLSPVNLIDPFSGNTEEDAQMQTEYEETYDFGIAQGQTGVIGYIEIPKISVDLPIYHGTSDETLEKGAGHLIGSSLPTGKTGTHSVLTGHSGLTSAKLFTDLQKLGEGDQFIIEIQEHKWAYQIDSIQIIEPQDQSWFTISPDKEEVTLLTCTPIGINTHRLIVTGHRVPYEDVTEVTPITDWYKVTVLSLLGLALILLIILGIRKALKKKLKNQEQR